MDKRLTDDEIRDILQETKAIRKGHFVLTSGMHSDTYVQCARVLEYPALTNKLAKEAVARFPQNLKIDMVASPAVGGILYGYAIAAALNKPLIFSERVEGKMVFRRSFEVPAGARVLVAEDVVTTGGSVKEVCDLVLANGGKVVGVTSLVDRGTDRKFSQDFYPLVRLEVAAWEPEECQLCAQGIETYSPGSRRI